MLQEKSKQEKFARRPILIMMAVCFLALISELLPSGLLSEMGASFSVGESKVGNLVGIYSLPAAVLAIPITQYTRKFNRKSVLQFILAGYSLASLVIYLAPNYYVALIGRLVGGAVAGAFWPMISPYASEVVSSNHSGRAITIVLSGVTVGVSVGLPLFTKIGQISSWRTAFLLLGISFLTLLILAVKELPTVAPANELAQPSVLSVLKVPGIRWSLVLVFTMVLGHYATYVFIQLICQRVNIDLSLAQILFGFGCILVSVIVARYIDSKLGEIFVAVYLLGILVMLVLLHGAFGKFIMYVVMFIWGISYGPMSTLLQTNIMKQVNEGKDTASAIKSMAFDCSIMLSSLIGGNLLDKWGIQANLIFAVIMFSIALVVLGAKREYFFDK